MGQNTYNLLVKRCQELVQRKQQLEIRLSNSIQQPSIGFNQTNLNSSTMITSTSSLSSTAPPLQFQLVANTDEGFTNFLSQEPIVLTNSANYTDLSDYSFNAQLQQQQQEQEQKMLSSSSLNRLIDSVCPPTSIDHNNNDPKLYNSVAGSFVYTRENHSTHRKF